MAQHALKEIQLLYLFCGDHEAAVSMSGVCSLLAIYKAHKVNPRDYLNEVIARIPYMQNASHDELCNSYHTNVKITMDTTIITAMAAYSNERVAAIVISVLYRMLTFLLFVY